MNKFCVLMISDDKYAVYTGVTITSLFENNKALESLDVYIVNNNISPKNILNIQKIAEIYHRNIFFLEADMYRNLIKEYRLPEYQNSLTPYMKLLAIESLCDEYERVIYLDGDIVVSAGIEDLINLDLNNRIMAAATELESYMYELRGFDRELIWFNGGVLVFDTNKWKKENCQKRVLEFMKRPSFPIMMAEQDVFNAVLRNDIESMSHRYNLMTVFLYMGYRNAQLVYDWTEQERDALMEESRNPIIYHCFPIMGKRPWDKGYAMESVIQWKKYFNLTPWDSYPEGDRKIGFISTIQGFMERVLPKMLYYRVYKFTYRMYIRRRYKELV